jgi:hypothetical protein
MRGQRLDLALLGFRLERCNRFAGQELGHVAGMATPDAGSWFDRIGEPAAIS